LSVRVKPKVRPQDGYRRKELDVATAEMACAVARGQLAYYRELERRGEIRIVSDREQLEGDNVGVIVSMEGADPVVGPSDLQRWFEDGLRAIGLAHYGQGRYAMGTGENGPLTAEGFELLREMERVGMILDLTHCAEPRF